MKNILNEAKAKGFNIFVTDGVSGIPDYAYKSHYIILHPSMTEREVEETIQKKFKEFKNKDWYFEANGIFRNTVKTPENPEKIVNKSDAYNVYAAIESERQYQIANEDKNGSHIVSSLNMGGILTAIQYNLNKAQETWYNEKEPYSNTTELLRKIAALCVKAGEDYGMVNRK